MTEEEQNIENMNQEPALPAEGETDQPVEQSVEQPVEQTVEQPAAEEPVIQPETPAVEQPVESVPAEEPVPAVEEPVSLAVEEVRAPVNREDARWYVIQTFTGQEDRVKMSIDLTVRQRALQDRVFQVLVPTEETVEIKGGKRLEKVKKMFPGYVFLEMILNEETWYQIRQTPGVARFIGTKVQPTPVSGKEMQRVLKQLGKEERFEVTFEKGEGVRIISGAFRGYTGTVDEVNAEKGKLKILVNIFGRDTPVEVNFEHAQKIV